MPAKPLVKILKSSSFLEKVSRHFAKPRWELIRSHLVGRKVLEFGLGMGTLAKFAQEAGFHVTGVDVDNSSLHASVQPVIYDGKHLPFADNSFDSATVVCVLHHIKNNLHSLREIMRVSKRAIVIEDTFRNEVEYHLVSFRDSLENLEFQEHYYRKYQDWHETCVKEGWQVSHIKSWSSLDYGLLYGRQSCFIIDQI